MNDLTPNLLDLDRFAVEVEKVEKPWGHELIWASTERYCGKVLFIKGGEELSLQFHKEKDETTLLEVSPPELADIVRFEARYGRADAYPLIRLPRRGHDRSAARCPRP